MIKLLPPESSLLPIAEEEIPVIDTSETFLSIAWFCKLLNVYLCYESEFKAVLIIGRDATHFSKPPLERLIPEHLDRTPLSQPLDSPTKPTRLHQKQPPPPSFSPEATTTISDQHHNDHLRSKPPPLATICNNPFPPLRLNQMKLKPNTISYLKIQSF
ncbi:hypothetical protein L1887_27574 [Cichorium endivia]|nr:hypothetical protein L1887_27574 [Cichorium endivia]